MNGLWWKILLKWMMWGYPIVGNLHFLKYQNGKIIGTQLKWDLNGILSSSIMIVTNILSIKMGRSLDTWWFIPRIVSGLVHPSFEWTLPPLIPFMTRVITHLLSGMNHQVEYHVRYFWPGRWPTIGRVPLTFAMASHLTHMATLWRRVSSPWNIGSHTSNCLRLRSQKKTDPIDLRWQGTFSGTHYLVVHPT